MLVTRRPDGRPQSAPVLTALDGEGRACVSTREGTAKARNLAHDPWAMLCVLNDGFYGSWVSVEGPVEVVHLPEALELLVEYYRTLSGEHPDWDEYRAAMVRDKRVLVRVTIEHASGG